MNPRYLRMIERMKPDGERVWSVYILRCGDGSLYTGIAKDVQARFQRHSEGKGAAYTRTRRPLTMVYLEIAMTRSEALVREAGLKRLSKLKKEKLVAAATEAQPT